MIYLTIIPRVRVGYEMVKSQRGASYPTHLISNKRERNDCFIKNAHKISEILICKNSLFQPVFNFEQTRTVTIFGEHGIMAHIP